MKRLLSRLMVFAVLATITMAGVGVSLAVGESSAARQAALRIGLVTDAGGVDDASLNRSAWEGVQRAGEELGAEVAAQETATPEPTAATEAEAEETATAEPTAAAEEEAEDEDEGGLSIVASAIIVIVVLVIVTGVYALVRRRKGAAAK
jgi:cobalamin biosynthesis Mg chelatase CobN